MISSERTSTKLLFKTDIFYLKVYDLNDVSLGI